MFFKMTAHELCICDHVFVTVHVDVFRLDIFDQFSWILVVGFFYIWSFKIEVQCEPVGFPHIQVRISVHYLAGCPYRGTPTHPPLKRKVSEALQVVMAIR